MRTLSKSLAHVQPPDGQRQHPLPPLIREETPTVDHILGRTARAKYQHHTDTGQPNDLLVWYTNPVPN